MATIPLPSCTRDDALPCLEVLSCEDFEITGRELNRAWEKTQWVVMRPRPGNSRDYVSRFKLLYSTNGIYLLFDGQDQVLTATLQEDFSDLWEEDVFECFFWTDARHPIYFEYEISPLGYELPILVPNVDGRFLGWRPWHYAGNRRTRKAVSIRGGAALSGAAVEGWSAEVFLPFELLRPLGQVPPHAKTQWRANFYRMDYDFGQHSSWNWAEVGSSFHEFEKFGTLIFL